jgi:hypothetical protein
MTCKCPRGFRFEGSRPDGGDFDGVFVISETDRGKNTARDSGILADRPKCGWYYHREGYRYGISHGISHVSAKSFGV